MTTIAPPSKNTRRGKKNAGKAQKNAGAPQKNAGGARKNADAAMQNAETDREITEIQAADAPPLARVALVAPTRTGRAVEDLAGTLERAEVRLKLAWKYRNVLDAALPQEPPFHAHAWTALEVVRAGDADAAGAGGDGKGSAASAVELLLGELMTLRNAVEFTTRPGDAARDALRFDVTLRATHGLVDVAPEVIAGARSVQRRFPALTDAALADAESALRRARARVAVARRGSVDDAVARIDTADDRQLALDVLLDCVDHLRAAARTTLHKTRPRLCEALCAPIERARARAAAEPVADGEKKPQ